jgi:diadenosine tetraphosphate (Ap4A) HIT family hydrolase
MKNLMNVGNARTDMQRKQMTEIAKKGICPFCRKHFEQNHAAPIIRETRHWILTRNDYPYDGVKTHLLLVHKKHVESVSQVSPAAMKDLGTILGWIEDRFKIRGGTLLLRFGDMKYTGATIAHLHAHVVSGVKESGKSEPVKKRIAFVKK